MQFCEENKYKNQGVLIFLFWWVNEEGYRATTYVHYKKQWVQEKKKMKLSQKS